MMPDRRPDDNGIYYFLGNITSHILHALPLHKEIGGTFVVTSDRARKEIEQLYRVPVINVDNKPYKWLWPGKRPKRIHEYITMDRDLKKTYDFLNTYAKVVVFYELFELIESTWLERPKKIFLTHGNMLKSYMTMYPKRLEIVKDYDYMAALGPHMKQQFIKDGVAPEKLVDIGVARTDEVVKHAGNVVLTDEFTEALGTDPNKKIISYMPTFWGASSIYDTGQEIIRNFPESYTLIFRPHPQTPNKLLKKYQRLIDKKSNVIYAPEGRFKHIGLLDIFAASSAIMGDVSSIMLEAILTDKPLIFVYGTGSRRQEDRDYVAIRDIVAHSEKVDAAGASSIDSILEAALKRDIDFGLWQKAKHYNFFHHDGGSSQTIAKLVTSFSQVQNNLS